MAWSHFVAGVLVATLAAITVGGAAAASPSPFIIRQHIDAEVTSVDAQAREVRLRTDAGRFTLRGVATATITTTARIVMDVTIIRHQEPSTLPRASNDPPPLVAQRLRASVVGLDRGVGVVALSSAAGRLAVELPSTVVRTLRTGDALWLDIALRPAPDVSASPRDEDTQRKKGLKALFLMLLGRTK
jgi:hypothetical protein